jgi:uncharacterized FlaG/YvyC family protein
MKIGADVLIPRQLVIPEAHLEHLLLQHTQLRPQLIVPAPDLGATEPKKEEKRKHHSRQSSVSKDRRRLSEETDETKNDSDISFREENLESLQDSVQQANQIAEALNYSLRFGVDNASGNEAVKVVEPKTDNIIQIIPAAQFLNFVVKLRQQAGIFCDQEM